MFVHAVHVEVDIPRHHLRILQPILRPLRLQTTPVLAKVKTSLVLPIREQGRVAQLRASVCLRPQSYSDGVGALIVDYAWGEREACLRADLRDEFAICEEVSIFCDG